MAARRIICAILLPSTTESPHIPALIETAKASECDYLVLPLVKESFESVFECALKQTSSFIDQDLDGRGIGKPFWKEDLIVNSAGDPFISILSIHEESHSFL